MYLKQEPDMSIRYDIKILIDHHQSNLAIIYNTACKKKELDMVEPHFKSAMVSFNCNWVLTDHWNIEVDEFEDEFDSSTKMCCPCIGVEENVNITNAQKELLLQHWKLGTSMYHVLRLKHVHTAKKSNGKHSLMPTVFKLKFGSTSYCSFPKCTSCELTCAKKCDPQVVQQHATKEKKVFWPWTSTKQKTLFQWINLLSDSWLLANRLWVRRLSQSF